MSQKIRAAMIGGGPGSFIGAVHRIAARMDGDYELVAGAFSSNPEKCLETARLKVELLHFRGQAQ